MLNFLFLKEQTILNLSKIFKSSEIVRVFFKLIYIIFYNSFIFGYKCIAIPFSYVTIRWVRSQVARQLSWYKTPD